MKARTRRLLVIFIFFLIFIPGHSQAAQDVTITHALAMSGTPRYPAGFTHFDYVNPHAPKGGSARLSAVGTFDSFNPFIAKGVSVSGNLLIYDSLTVASSDEPFTQYGLIAEKIEIPGDRSWVIYHINPQARFHDGKPITAHDVVFTFNVLMSKGSPLYKKYYADVEKVKALDKLRVKFHLGQKPNPELALILGQINVLPKHYWENRDFSKTTLDIPLGSGPYKISKFKPGHSVTYERVKDYWAKNHPVNKGRFNFNTITIDYYRDATVALHAFKSGEYDFRLENIAKNWATAYTGPAVDNGLIIKEEIKHEQNQGMQCFVFNTRRSFFKDRKVRQALAYAFDFEWSNKTFFYNQYRRSASFFSNSELASSGLPSPEELAILEPFRGRLPQEVFTKEYIPPKTEGSGDIRGNLRQAVRLLKEAGWVIKKKKLTNIQTGRILKFEILLISPSFERIVLPFRKNLSRLGIVTTSRVVDTSQYINRLNEFDFDMIVFSFGQSLSPGNEQRYFWHSSSADIPGSRNYIGLKNPVVDALVDLIIQAPSRKDLVNRTKALDRVLLWGHYVIPQWHLNYFRVAYWNKFSHPQKTPKYDLDFYSWWINPQKKKVSLR
ncbi:MAG: ABC transporter substrate-binding protein [Deltaproteobacteria bacterium]|nr:ABC transporter substrate-binding protein [Deltaproteobacteria bacterium]MBW2085379.1 ABC transporter substrate-binding protein [Deltaproteobacteria bacterium]